MGRVSKRGNSLRKTAGIHSEQNVKVRRYRAGIYARLSADHDERKNESVEVQIEIARKYIEEFNLKNTEEIIDIIDECIEENKDVYDLGYLSLDDIMY